MWAWPATCITSVMEYIGGTTLKHELEGGKIYAELLRRWRSFCKWPRRSSMRTGVP